MVMTMQLPSIIIIFSVFILGFATASSELRGSNGIHQSAVDEIDKSLRWINEVVTSPSSTPTAPPTSQPSHVPSVAPSTRPSQTPSLRPSNKPSLRPSAKPSRKPSSRPSKAPSRKPSSAPSKSPPIRSGVNIVINEIMRNPDGTDTNKEWIELYNAGTVRVNLRNWQLYDDVGAPFRISPSVDLFIEVGGYIVLGQSNNTATNGGYKCDFAYGTGIELYHSDMVYIKQPGSAYVHDLVSFTNEWPNGYSQPGRSMSLISPRLENQLLSSWCATPAVSANRYGNNFATPGRVNVC